MTVILSAIRRTLPRRTAAAVCLALLAASAPAAAQAPDNERTPAAWRVECSGDGKTLPCRALQQARSEDGKRAIAVVTVRYPEDAKEPTMMIQLPLGLNLAEGVAMTIDDGDAERHPLQTCTGTGCFAGLQIDAKLLSTLRGGQEMTLTYQDTNDTTFDAAISLLGFSLALDKLK